MKINSVIFDKELFTSEQMQAYLNNHKLDFIEETDGKLYHIFTIEESLDIAYKYFEPEQGIKYLCKF